MRKGFDEATGRYATTHEQEDVGCEACHGPGGGHVAQVEAGRVAEDPGLVVQFEAWDPAAWRRPICSPETTIWR